MSARSVTPSRVFIAMSLSITMASRQAAVGPHDYSLLNNKRSWPTERRDRAGTALRIESLTQGSTGGWKAVLFVKPDSFVDDLPASSKRDLFEFDNVGQGRRSDAERGPMLGCSWTSTRVGY